MRLLYVVSMYSSSVVCTQVDVHSAGSQKLSLKWSAGVDEIDVIEGKLVIM